MPDPTPKSTFEKKRDGTWRPARDANKADVLFEATDPIKPVGFTEEESWIWDLVVDGMPPQLRSQLDAPLLTMLCHAWSEWVAIKEEMKSADRAERYKLRIEAMMAYKQVRDLGPKFGLSTQDRAKLKLPMGSGEEADPLKDVLDDRTD